MQVAFFVSRPLKFKTHPMRLRLCISAFFCWSCLPLIANEESLSLLTQGGGQIEPGDSVPGLIELLAESADSLLKDASGNIVAAAGIAPEGAGGRVVCFSHDSFLKSPAMLVQGPHRALLTNVMRWSGRGKAPKIVLHSTLTALAKVLEEEGLEVRLASPAELDPADPPAVYVLVAQRGLSEDDLAQLLELAKGGMGLIIGATPWPFANDYPDFARFPANRLARAAGIRLKPQGTARNSEPYPVRFVSAATVLEAMDELSGAGNGLDPTRRDELLVNLREGVSLRGAALDTFLVGLESLNRKIGPIVPTPEIPLVPKDLSLQDAIVKLEDSLNQSLPAGRMYAIPAASEYPGAVPTGATRLEKTVTLDGRWHGWLSGRGAAAWKAKEMRPTGLYAAPGEVITVEAPREIVGQGFEVVIGAYAGNLDNREKWERYPRLQRSVDIDGSTTAISNALGGLITIRVPDGATFGALDFTIKGGVEAPLYIAGKTDLKEWRDTIRRSPAPWAELASERIILAIPSSFIRDLDDPDQVMKVWDEIIEKAAELCGDVDRTKYRAERIVFERQPSAGYMHSGYPVAAPQDKSAIQAVDSRSLRTEGNWGFFHEYGHNHQHDLWALPGTGETTCNLWSVYLFEEYIGKPRAEGHDAIRPLDRKQRMNAYFEGGRDFAGKWSMWVALEPYLQVQEAFGWEPFAQVFADYNSLPEADWPRDQQAKNDQWVIRLSRACGKNLAPYWAAWNVPLSSEVAAQLADLPAWEKEVP